MKEFNDKIYADRDGAINTSPTLTNPSVKEMKMATGNPTNSNPVIQIKERPILFSGAMVRAILGGLKTQTRRVFKFKETNQVPSHPDKLDFTNYSPIHCPYGKPGDRLWVRETWNHYDLWTPGPEGYGKAVYRATDEPGKEVGWRPSIFMPRWASRINLEITNVRVERLNDISAEDVVAEGVDLHPDNITRDLEPYFPEPTDDLIDDAWTAYYRTGFAELWDKINGKKQPWSSNPWVWVVEFKKV